MINLYRGSTIDASCEVSVHLANWFQRGIIFKISQTEKRITCGGIFVNGSGPKKEIVDGTCHRCFLQSFGWFGQAVSEKKNFRNRPIRNKNFLWRPRLLMDQDEMNNLYRWPSIDAFYQDSVHLAYRFQRRKKIKISQSETRITCGGHVWKWIGTKWAILKENHTM
jgi:hypothetical protein